MPLHKHLLLLRLLRHCAQALLANEPLEQGTLHACLQTEDLELLLARRGHPTLSHNEPLHEPLVERLGKALSDEFCRFEWESGQVPAFHAGAPPPGHSCAACAA